MHRKCLPTGLGDPVFEKLDANLGKAILSIGAVKAFEIGDGMAVASATGRSNNDPFLLVKTEPSGRPAITPEEFLAESAMAVP